MGAHDWLCVHVSQACACACACACALAVDDGLEEG